MARAPRRLTQATAEYWVHRWRGCLSPPPDAEQRARRLGQDVHRYRILQADITSLDAELTDLLAATQGQILTTLPGVAVTRAATFAAFSLTIAHFLDAERRYQPVGSARLHPADPAANSARHLTPL
jgi:transposase